MRPLQHYKATRKLCGRDKVSRRFRSRPRMMIKLSKNSVNQRELRPVINISSKKKKRCHNGVSADSLILLMFISLPRRSNRADISSSPQFMRGTCKSIIIINSRILKQARIRGALTRPEPFTILRLANNKSLLIIWTATIGRFN